MVAVHANRFAIENGILTGEVDGEIVDAQYKANVLRQLTQQYQIEPNQTIAIGDGAMVMNDADCGSPAKVQQQAQTMVNFADLWLF